MKYINKKTKAVIETACEIKGGDWEPVKSKKKKKDADDNQEESKDESGEQ